jgi:predicted amidohydrolase
MTWKTAVVALCLPCAVFCAAVDVRQSGFKAAEGGLPAGWNVWAARSEIAPRTFVDPVHYRTAPGSLAISGDSNPAAYGGWEYSVPGVEAGKWYRFTAYYKTVGVPNEPLQVVARICWFRADGKGAARPDYPYAVTPEGEWTRLTLDAPAPENATTATLQLFLGNAPSGTLWWDDISFTGIPTPKPRPVTIASVKYYPRRGGSPAENVSQFVEVIRKTVPEGVDLVLLPEGITVAGTGKTDVDVAEPVPGPTTARLSEIAAERKVYIVAGLYEREGRAVYNTAVLIGRKGEIVGKYRKVYLPREEIEAGLTPGDDYPVFRTDFGTVGIMICWDSEYADPARALALRGAEIILMPIWDGTPQLVVARAIENRTFLAQSSYGDASLVMDPQGETQATTKQQGTAAVATIDLNRRYNWNYLGNMRERFMKELRLDVPMKRPGFVR